MNTYVATSLADDRRRQYVSDAASHADAYVSLRTNRTRRHARTTARRHSIRPVRAFRTWLAAGLL
ncbi:MAG TPA: hypothetical protein VJ831_15195 [Jatrophihabitantaceae bacterium]|nr:hypothetical protein [Jatrophihabitantaceae bacterium]